MSSSIAAREVFLAHLREAVETGSLVKLTLGRPATSDTDLRNLYVRPVELKKGPHLCFLWRHQTRDITKNHPPAEALAELARSIGPVFRDAHLFTATTLFELKCQGGGKDFLKHSALSAQAPKLETSHNRSKEHLIATDSPWLHALGITNDRGAPRPDMSGKFRQIQKFAELLKHHLEEAGLLGENPTAGQAPLRIVDMGCGKGYLTFAIAALLGPRAQVTGVELRPELVTHCNRIASDCGMKWLRFQAGSIADATLESPDVVIALHACDTATDDAIARGIQAGAKLLVLSPCCQKELRAQLQAPPVLADALRHGIFQERQAEFLTDALRAELLEWQGYRTKVFEFISTEHTAKNLMLTATLTRDHRDEARAPRIRELAAAYGIRHQALAAHLSFPL